jgi:hypothetical protein
MQAQLIGTFTRQGHLISPMIGKVVLRGEFHELASSGFGEEKKLY